MLTGSLVAIATPMGKGGSLDLPVLGKLIDFHVANGTAGIVAVGTTGESPTVDFDEHCLLIKAAVQHARGRIPIVAGTGANSTSEAIALTAYAKEAGAHSCLSVVPYYNKPTQEGLYRHFRAIAEKVDLPLILYNVPGRTVADLANDTVLRLAQVPGIVGIKDATADLGRGSELIKALAAAKQARLRRLQRRRHHGTPAAADGRPRRDLGHRQRGAEADGRDVQGGARRRHCRGARAATTACCRCTASCSSRRIRFP